MIAKILRRREEWREPKSERMSCNVLRDFTSETGAIRDKGAQFYEDPSLCHSNLPVTHLVSQNWAYMRCGGKPPNNRGSLSRFAKMVSPESHMAWVRPIQIYMGP